MSRGWLSEDLIPYNLETLMFHVFIWRVEFPSSSNQKASMQRKKKHVLALTCDML